MITALRRFCGRRAQRRSRLRPQNTASQVQHRRRQAQASSSTVFEQVQAARGIAAHQQDQQQSQPRPGDVHRGVQRPLAEAVAARKGEREHQQAQHRVGPPQRLVRQPGPRPGNLAIVMAGSMNAATSDVTDCGAL
jgi:hypothetical protein